MEKFGVSFGGGPSRKELLEAVEHQRGQLAHYQARLKDVVQAYKGLLKEKDALEASLKALSLSHQLDASGHESPGQGGCGLDPTEDKSSGGHSKEDGSGPPGRKGDVARPASEEEEEEAAVAVAVAVASAVMEPSPCETEEASGPESGGNGVEACAGAAAGSAAERHILQLKAQLATLTAALATVSQEKSRTEASYQADKRRLKQEMEEAARQAEEERVRLENEAQAAREQLAETKARLLAQQHDRAQEQSDHAIMLRELQRLLQSERALRQEAERGLEESREALAGKASAADRAEEAERRACRLAHEVEELEGELRALREETGRPNPQLQALQAETAHAEERIRAEEQRAASLEAQISEASELLGSYEKAKQRDQLAIQRLRERLAQLDLENKTLALAASGRCPLPDVGLEESSLDVNVLRDRMEKLRGLLRAATKQDPGEGEASPHKREAPVDPEEEEEADGEKVSVAYYQRELKRLKEEFEHYKQEKQQQQNRTAAVAQDGGSVGELAEAQAQLVALREKYVSLRLSHEELARRHQEEAEARRQEAARIQQRHKEELERVRRDSREEALQLEEEVRRQRERALAILAEKDQELDRLRALAWPHSGLPLGGKPPSPPPMAPGPLPPASLSPGPKGPLESLTQALRLSSPGEPPFLLYTEQLARRAVELSALRKEKRRLEGESRRLRECLLAAEERHREEVGALQGHLQKSARDQGREGANLEYLKNVFFRFLTLADGLGRQQTLGAILTVLHFSPEEREAVLSQAGGGGTHSWWPSGKR
ncbi:hypothetical protein JD844_029157 [Phrynosoma platyrhinos]|uniref:GRIP domain-containing protein n=1 Tax=Phrynosoma platyrhinos TaxID=52577 RepID=A0ABQ7SIX1_PHRPL|nr:hypothetical protein JD844_029157 [Phrynosoma platyrhinos]